MRFFLIAAVCLSATAFADDKKEHEQDAEDLNNKDASPVEYFWARDVSQAQRANAAARARSPLMTYHGGKIMPTAMTQSIFWGSSWTSSDGKISGLDSFYTGFSNSNYAKTSDEYTGSNGQVGAATTHLGHLIDVTPV